MNSLSNFVSEFFRGKKEGRGKRGGGGLTVYKKSVMYDSICTVAVNVNILKIMLL